ncbi:MAG TPA: prepilin-type N-terminal cleavage/methylation domain-containing protein [Anaerohalosphaeraceae bacterium]|nr:prepilin-type N-terminal cleavage/methylation domain-containing protein [Anaerohalosphaeraceae bacterium]
MTKNGFTLIELMIVVAILGILAAIVLPQVEGHTVQAKEAAVKDTLYTVRTQIQLYKLQHNGLAPGYINTTQATPTILGYQLTGTLAMNGLAVSSKVPSTTYPFGPYLSSLPVNPYNNLSTIKMVSAETTDFSTAADNTTGWLYQKETATFKINKTGTDSQGVPYVNY